MTPNEFKAWFDGFTEAFTGVPTKAQWTRVKDRVAEIDGKPVTDRVFVDRYWPTYINQYPAYRQPYWSTYCSSTAGNPVGAATTGQMTAGLALVGQNSVSNATFDSCSAMLDLGRADAKALAR